MIRKNLANIITAIRLIGAFSLMSATIQTPEFLITYTICGITDVLDGFVARRFNCISEFGSKLDSAADLVFYSVMMYKIWPVLLETLPNFLWTCIWTIVGIRIACYVYVALRFHQLASEHTILNKISGLLFFLLPYTIKQTFFIKYAMLIIIVTFIAAIYEFYIHLNKPDK